MKIHYNNENRDFFSSKPSFQWTSGTNGGFSSASSWLPISRDHLNPKWNVKDAAKDENSTLNLVKNMAEEKARLVIWARK